MAVAGSTDSSSQALLPCTAQCAPTVLAWSGYPHHAAGTLCKRCFEGLSKASVVSVCALFRRHSHHNSHRGGSEQGHAHKALQLKRIVVMSTIGDWV